ncbi:MAG: CapA family protein [Spirochaetaceae bacterium]
MNRSQNALRLFLAGDVMLGRGIDQALEHSCDPLLREPYVTDAREYLRLAESVNGALGAPLGPEEPWGEVLQLLKEEGAGHFFVNLETAVTNQGTYWPEKGIHYRMHPENVAVLQAAGVECCSLANNHAMDFDRSGLEETLSNLEAARIQVVGAGYDRGDARKPTFVGAEPTEQDGSGKSRPGAGPLALVAACFPDSGVPYLWNAEHERSGVFFLEEPGESAAEAIVDAFREVPEETPRLLSLHWGGNWGYEISEKQRRFARALIESGTVDFIFGHSSHHAKEIELYRDRGIVYGAGDLINDYEGIGGHREYRPELGLLYVVELTRNALLRMEAIPFRRRRFRLERVSGKESGFFRRVLSHHGTGPAISVDPDGRLVVELRPS